MSLKTQIWFFVTHTPGVEKKFCKNTNLFLKTQICVLVLNYPGVTRNCGHKQNSNGAREGGRDEREGAGGREREERARGEGEREHLRKI